MCTWMHSERSFETLRNQQSHLIYLARQMPRCHEYHSEGKIAGRCFKAQEESLPQYVLSLCHKHRPHGSRLANQKFTRSYSVGKSVLKMALYMWLSSPSEL